MKKYKFTIISLIISIFCLVSCSKNNINFQGENSASVTIGWQKTFGDIDFDEIYQIIKTSDGGYIAVGTKLIDINWDFWVLKFDSQDSLQWQQIYGGANTDIANSVVETDDGGFLVMGYTNSYDGNISVTKGNYDVWIIKIDNAGQLIWNQNYGGTANESTEYKSLIKTIDNNFIFAATTQSTDYDVAKSNGAKDIWVVKIDSIGKIIWERTYGGSGNDFAETIKAANDSTYFVCNISDSFDGMVDFNYGDKDVWIMKLNFTGNLIWQKTLGGNRVENYATLDLTQDGGFVVMNSTNSNDGDIPKNYGELDVLFTKFNASGVIQWRKIYGGSSNENIGDIMQTSDGGYLATVKSSSSDGYLGSNNGKDDLWFLKLASTGEIEWTKILGGSKDEFALSFIQTSDNTLIVAGTSNSDDIDISKHIGGFDLWLFELKY